MKPGIKSSQNAARLATVVSKQFVYLPMVMLVLIDANKIKMNTA